MSLKIDGQRSSQTYGAGGHKRSGKETRQRVGRAQYVPQQQPTQTDRGVRFLDVAVTRGGDDGRYAYDILRCDCLGDQECVLTPSVTNIPLSFKGADFTIGCWPVIHDDSPDKLKWVETTHARNTPQLTFHDIHLLALRTVSSCTFFLWSGIRQFCVHRTSRSVWPRQSTCCHVQLHSIHLRAR